MRQKSIIKKRQQRGAVLVELSLLLGTLVLIVSGILILGSRLLLDIKMSESLRSIGLRISRLEAPPGSKLIESDYVRCNTYAEIILEELKKSNFDPKLFKISAELGDSIEIENYPSQVITLKKYSTQYRSLTSDFSNSKQYSISLVSLGLGKPVSCKDIFKQGGKL